MSLTTKTLLAVMLFMAVLSATPIPANASMGLPYAYGTEPTGRHFPYGYFGVGKKFFKGKYPFGKGITGRKGFYYGTKGFISKGFKKVYAYPYKFYYKH